MDGCDRLCASCWGYVMSVVLPAPQCPMGEAEELDLEGEMRGKEDTQVGERHAKRLGGPRQCRDGADGTGARRSTCVPGRTRLLSLAGGGERGGFVLFCISRGKQHFETVRNVMNCQEHMKQPRTLGNGSVGSVCSATV